MRSSLRGERGGRLKKRALTWALWAALGLSACAMVRADQRPPASTPTPPVTNDPARAATNLSAISGCSETELRKPIAQMRWTAASARVTGQTPAPATQYIDVTTRTDGFVGSYKSSPALGADVTSFTWDAVETGINHYWRVVTVYPGIAVASEVASFKGAVCVADFQPSQSPAIASPSARATAAVTTLVPQAPLTTSTVATSSPTSAPAETVVAAAPSSAPADENTPTDGAPGALVGALIAATLVGTFLWWSRRGPA